jgi:hypothetical protein
MSDSEYSPHIPAWISVEVKETWNAMQGVGQMEAYRIMERMVRRIGYEDLRDPSLAAQSPSKSEIDQTPRADLLAILTDPHEMSGRIRNEVHNRIDDIEQFAHWTEGDWEKARLWEAELLDGLRVVVENLVYDANNPSAAQNPQGEKGT